jgi:hypothetical protein
MRQINFRNGFLLAVVLAAAFGLITACQNNNPTNSSGNGTSSSVPMTFNIQNSINTYAVLQMDIGGYPSGTTYTLPVSVSSGASTVFNFEIPAGVYSVTVFDNNNQHDVWSPVTLVSGTNFSLLMNSGSATLNSTNCSSCGI